jgi:hypothetical protein
LKTRPSYSLCRPSRSHGMIEGKWKCRGTLPFVCLPLTFRDMWKGRKYFSTIQIFDTLTLQDAV